MEKRGGKRYADNRCSKKAASPKEETLLQNLFKMWQEERNNRNQM
jgi:hypothetical protein